MPQKQIPKRWASAAVATIGLTVATTVIAMAARAPLSRSTPVDAAAARAPLTALFLLLVGAAIVSLAAIAMAVWSGRRAGKDEPRMGPEPPQIHWISKALTMLLPFALGGALVAAGLLGARASHHAARFGGGGPARAPLSAPAGAGGGATGFVLAPWLLWTVLAIALVAIAAGVLLLRRREPPADEPPERSAARAAVQAAIGALDSATDPRRAVIAAYVAMEETLAAQGVARSPAEAPREYLRRVLVAGNETERDARTLTGLFEEARFSTHPVSERVRELALSALSSLRARLPVGGAG